MAVMRNVFNTKVEKLIPWARGISTAKIAMFTVRRGQWLSRPAREEEGMSELAGAAALEIQHDKRSGDDVRVSNRSRKQLWRSWSMRRFVRNAAFQDRSEQREDNLVPPAHNVRILVVKGKNAQSPDSRVLEKRSYLVFDIVRLWKKQKSDSTVYYSAGQQVLYCVHRKLTAGNGCTWIGLPAQSSIFACG